MRKEGKEGRIEGRRWRKEGQGGKKEKVSPIYVTRQFVTSYNAKPLLFI